MAEEKKYEVPAYNDTYRQQMNDTYNAITNRQPFTYDVNGDALYQQYRDKYIQGGKMAMKDTMGQAAALTGGYGSSYGQAVGQQQYDAYLQNLNDVIPQLYDTAYQRYRDQGNDLEKQYAMLGELSADEYNKYRDQMSDYRYNQEWQAQQDAVAYSKQQDAYNRMYNMIMTTGYKPTEKQLKAAGMTQKEANALLKAYQKNIGGGGGGGSYSYTPAGSDEEDLKTQLEKIRAVNNQANTDSMNSRDTYMALYGDSGFETYNPNTSAANQAMQSGNVQAIIDYYDKNLKK